MHVEVFSNFSTQSDSMGFLGKYLPHREFVAVQIWVGFNRCLKISSQEIQANRVKQ